MMLLPEVCPSRVRRLTIDIADFGIRPLAGHIEPSEATCRIRPTTNAYLMVTPPIFCAGYSANRSATAHAYLPPKYPGTRGVTQDFAKSFSAQHGQPKYFSKCTVNNQRAEWHEFNKCLECEIAPVEDQNIPSTAARSSMSAIGP